jgi:anaerobic magnesium-protoporphyrin IX monomethyl ester cyclase
VQSGNFYFSGPSNRQGPRLKHILLINPPLTLEERYGDLAGAGSTMPSLGLAWLAAVCRKNGYEPGIIEAASGKMSFDEIVDRIIKCQARYVGLTAMTCGINSAALLARKIKQKDPGIQVLIGGAHITALPEETMHRFPAFDVGFLGEAEGTIVDYFKSMDAGDAPERVKGIVYRKDGLPFVTENRPFIEDLDSLPFPAWDLVPGFPDDYAPAIIRCKQLPASHIVTTRGCPMKCTFCDRSVFGTRYRLFSVDYTWEMVYILSRKFGVRDILFEDDSFTLNKTRVMSLCEKMRSKNSRLSWSCLGRVDTIDAELLSHMKKAGCWQIGFGIESGNAAVLDGADKKINLERIRETLTLTRAAGIHTKGFFILGLPHETITSIEETIRFAAAVALDDISVSFATPFPGTVLYEQAQTQGAFSPDWQKMNLLNVVFVPRGISKNELEESHAGFLRRFYLRPRILVDYFLRSMVDIKVFIRIMQGMFVVLGMVFRKGPRS